MVFERFAMNNNLVSVIMSTYKESREHLSLAVESILNQSYSNFEFIIVVDDPENTQLHQVLEQYCQKDPRIKLCYNQKNMGLTYSRNRCISLCSGSYVAIMDADDIAACDRIAVQKQYLDEHCDVDVVTSARIDIDENGNIITPFEGNGMSDELVPKILEYGDMLTNPTVMMRTDKLRQLEGYREVPSAEDYDLWLRCISEGMKIHIINKPLLRYRIRSDSLSRINYAKTWASTQYARKLYKQRKCCGCDSFSTADYAENAKKTVIKDKRSTDNFNGAYMVYNSAIDDIKQKKLLRGVSMLIRSCFMHSEIVKVFYVSYMMKLWMKKSGKS